MYNDVIVTCEVVIYVYVCFVILLVLANTLKPYCNKQTAKISTSGIAIISMLKDYSIQCRMVHTFSAVAWHLVSCDRIT